VEIDSGKQEVGLVSDSFGESEGRLNEAETDRSLGHEYDE
jgi:hypothetical protein